MAASERGFALCDVENELRQCENHGAIPGVPSPEVPGARREAGLLSASLAPRCHPGLGKGAERAAGGIEQLAQDQPGAALCPPSGARHGGNGSRGREFAAVSALLWLRLRQSSCHAPTGARRARGK